MKGSINNSTIIGFSTKLLLGPLAKCDDLTRHSNRKSPPKGGHNEEYQGNSILNRIDPRVTLRSDRRTAG
jgi:hypothetical protein